MELTKEYRWEGSHRLPKHKGLCKNLHGHSWKLFVSVEGPIDPETGFVMDFGDISTVVRPLIARLDHHHLGTWDGIDTYSHRESVVTGLPGNFYPTSENLLVWIGLQLKGTFRWSKLSIEETCTSRATLTREEYDGAAIK